MSVPTSPSLHRRLVLLDLLEKTMSQPSEPTALERELRELCDHQGLSPTPAQVHATLLEFTTKQPSVAPSPVSSMEIEEALSSPPFSRVAFTAWERPASMKEVQQIKDAVQRGKEDERRQNKRWRWPLRVTAGSVALKVGMVVTHAMFPHYVGETFRPVLGGVMVGSLVFGVGLALLLQLRNWVNETRRGPQSSVGIGRALEAKWENMRELNAYGVPTRQDMKAWLACPVTMSALKQLEQEPVPLLWLDANALHRLRRSWKQEQKKQKKDRKEAQMKRVWQDQIGDRCLADESAS